MPSAPHTQRVGEGFNDVMAAAQAGAEWAVAILYRSLQPRLLRFLRAQATAHDAEDIAAQTWLEIARALPRFTGDEDGFQSLVFTVARRRLADHRRSRRRRPVDFVDGGTLEVTAVGNAEDQALDRLGGEEAARRITAVLPPDQAEIVLLRVVAGLSVDQVATLVGRRPGTVRVLQHRALKRLAERLGDDL